MKKILLAFLLPVLCTFALAQPYQLGHRTITFTDASRSRAIPTELYYPANAAGNNVPVAAGSDSFAVVVFGHGFVIPYSSYVWLADSLVRNGYIVAFPTTEGGILPNHTNFGQDLAYLCQYLPTLNADGSSFLFGRVRQRSAVAGHSMGGGSSFLASSYNSGIKAIFNFAAAETNPSATTAALQTQCPALVFSGSADCIVPANTQLAMYNNVPYGCKSYINITGALHCQFANNNGTCALGQITTGCNSTSLAKEAVFAKTVALVVPFLNYYLRDSCESKTEFEDIYNSLEGIEKQRQCNADPFVCEQVTVYTFIGNGNWDVPSNWQNGIIPPVLLPAGDSILINPASDGECVLNLPQTIAAGATLKVLEGKKFRMEGNLTVQ